MKAKLTEAFVRAASALGLSSTEVAGVIQAASVDLELTETQLTEAEVVSILTAPAPLPEKEATASLNEVRVRIRQAALDLEATPPAIANALKNLSLLQTALDPTATRIILEK